MNNIIVRNIKIKHTKLAINYKASLHIVILDLNST